jgi:hypothetical protein
MNILNAAIKKKNSKYVLDRPIRTTTIFKICFFLEGNEPSKAEHYHPFYITDSAEGGFGQKDDAEQRKQRVFAGIVYDSDGYPFPTTGILLFISEKGF